MKYTTLEFVEKARDIHGMKYDYSLVNYKSSQDKIDIICPIHGVFKQRPSNHLQGHGCPKCGDAVKHTQQEFECISKTKHGNKYDYSKAIYINNESKVTIICPIHGEFIQRASNHMHGEGCPVCSREHSSALLKGVSTKTGEKLTYETFIRDVELNSSKQYNYDKVKYIDEDTPVIITCPDHGDFLMTPRHRKMGHLCPECAKEERSQKRRYTTSTFIQKAQEVHGETYDYSLVNYIDSKTKVKIICKEHGAFEQQPASHLMGEGCPICGREKSILSRRLTIPLLLDKCHKAHGNRYDYSLITEYTRNNIPIPIICPIHGIFYQSPSNHLNGYGCPKCGSSKCEEYIRVWLREHQISFTEQKRFEDLKDVRPLPFDFYIRANNRDYLLEFQGPHHYKKVERFKSTDESLIIQNYHDELKRNYAVNHGYEYIEIPYTEFNTIDTILNDILISQETNLTCTTINHPT